MIRHPLTFAILIAGFLLGGLSNAAAAPASDLWDRWSAHDPDSTRVIDHSAWDKLLQRFVIPSKDGVNRFAYAHFRKPHQRQLDDYIKSLARLPISQYNRDQQRAYWINLYNALTIDVVSTNFPLKSIRDISSGFLSSGPWNLELVKIEGVQVTLNDIEHRILRPIWQDARIHYVVNCASIGCPNLQTRAFTAKNSEGLLYKSAVEYINHPRAVKVIDNELQLSSIYDWYKDDFGGNDQAVITHLKRYASEDLRLALKQVDGIDNHSYDWNINSVSKPEYRSSSGNRGS